MGDAATLPNGRRGVALALGGGAALGWAHIGVLRVLREEGITIGAVAGTSIGALAALCLAAGRLDVLEEVALGATRRRTLAYLDPHLARGAWLGGRRIARELEGHFAGVRLEALSIPIAIVAADLDTAEEIRLVAGAAISAVQASMALPGIFPPVRRDGRLLIDGGMVSNVPVAAARAIAPRLPIVAVDLMGDYAGHVGAIGARGPRTALGTVRSAFLMMMVRQQQLAARIDPAEVTITVPVGHVSTGHFHRARELILLGEHAARTALPAIACL